MFHTDESSLELIPLRDLIVPHLNQGALLQGMQLSRGSHLFYRGPATWKKAIEAHFGISAATLNQFQIIVTHLTGQTDLPFQRLYRGLDLLHAPHDYACTIGESTLVNPTYHLSLLACCLDNVTVARKLLPKELMSLWRKAVIITDAVNIYVEFIPHDFDSDFQLASWKNTNAILRWFIKSKLPYLCAEDSYIRQVILSNADLSHVQYIVSRPALYSINRNQVLVDLLQNCRVPLSAIHDLLTDMAAQTSAPITLSRKFLDWFLRRINDEPDSASKIIAWLHKHNVNFDEPMYESQFYDLIIHGYVAYAKFLLLTNKVNLILDVRSLISFSITQQFSQETLSFLTDQRYPWALQLTSHLLVSLIDRNGFANFEFVLTTAGCQITLEEDVFTAALHAKSPVFLRRLQAHPDFSKFKPTQNNLSFAVREGQLEHLNLLLQPCYELTPTPQDLKIAILENHVEVIKVLMSHPRQFNLVFDQDMLATACQTRLGLAGSYVEPSLPVVQFMLQPQFGLAMTQALFDSLYDPATVSMPNVYQNYNSAEVLLYLLDTYGFTLSQERYEQLFCACRMSEIANLPITRKERFAHLKPTDKMLNHAIKRHEDLKNFAVHFLHPYYQLDVSSATLDKALFSEDEELIRLAMARCESPPSIAAVARYLCLGNFNLAREIIHRYAIPINRDLLQDDTLKGILTARLALILEFARQHGLLGEQTPYLFTASPPRNLESNELMLDPKYNIHYNPAKFGNLYYFSPAIENLIKSDLAIKQSLRALHAQEFHQAETSFASAFQHSPRQCYRVAAFALAHPRQYQLEMPARKHLLSLIVKHSASFSDLTLIEQMAIKKYLNDAYFDLIDRDDVAIAKELPVAVLETLVEQFGLKPGQLFIDSKLYQL